MRMVAPTQADSASAGVRRPARVGLLVGLLPLLALSACGDTTDCCIDGASGGVVAGVVLDRSYVAVGGADVRADGVRRPCDAPDGQQSPADGVARTDSTGFFTLRVVSFLGAPGAFCVHLVVTSGAEPPDTTDAIQVQFYDGEPQDTTHVLLRLGGA